MTPEPLAAALTAEATSVPCDRSWPGRVDDLRLRARSGNEVSTKSSTMPTVTPGTGAARRSHDDAARPGVGRRRVGDARR